jgi:hypothetical protein
MLGLIHYMNRMFSFPTTSCLMFLHDALVRPKLKCASVALTDSLKLERIEPNNIADFSLALAITDMMSYYLRRMFQHSNLGDSLVLYFYSVSLKTN